MVSQPERERILGAARHALLVALPDAWAVYVFGSFARAEDWPASDIDLAVLLPPARRIEDPLQVRSSVSAQAHREVDIVDLRRAGDVLRREVLAEGRVLYVSEPDHVLAWEAAAMSRYARHREEIRDILEDFSRTGVGYGG
jgi:predicted nucleotidyltransferase